MIEIKPLPYDYEALTPYISKETLMFHHDKHYVGYVNKVNELIKNTDLEHLSIENIILRAAGDTVYTTLFNNAAQVFNHEFYFASLTDKANEKEISPACLKLIEGDFGSLDALKRQLIDKGTTLFGSGYVWLVLKEEHLKIITTKNAELPLTEGFVYPLLAIDVWEHAYYLDKQNLRAEYLNQVVNNCLNWHFVATNLKRFMNNG